MTPKAPMDGLTVVDFTSMLAGPYCTRLLADTGATVIKIEAVSGDYIRQVAPFSGETSSYFGHLNCGKESLVLDLRNPDDKAIALQLIQSADVLVENFRPGVMKKLGLGWEDVSPLNPSLVYCSISGYGQTGPKSQVPAYAPIIHAASGYDDTMSSVQDEIPGPINCAVQTADIMAGAYAFGAIQTALVGRLRNGNGQYIDVSLMDAMINLMVYDTQVSQNPLDEPRAIYMPIRAADAYVTVAPINARNFQAMATAMGHPEWQTDPRFDTVSKRRANWKILMSLAEEWTLGRSAVECEDILSQAGVPCAKYQTLKEAIADPQVEHRGLMVRLESNNGGYLVPNPPFTFADGTVAVRPNVPDLNSFATRVQEAVKTSAFQSNAKSQAGDTN